MNATAIGLDIAGNAFQVDRINVHGKKAIGKPTIRKRVLPYSSAPGAASSGSMDLIARR